MSTEQHEALKHAALLNAEAWPAHMTLHKWADIAGSTNRTQHALIVQMAEALKHARQVLNHHNLPIECNPINVAIASANTYLKGPKP